MPKNTIRLYLLLTFMRSIGISLIAATYVIFMLSQGLTIFQVSIINFFFFATRLLFEVPTGALADSFGRKKSFITSCLLISVSMFLYSSARTFPGFIIAEIIGAIGLTFATGAFQAWLVDTLQHKNFKGELGPIFVKEHQITSVAAILGAISGGFLADILNISTLWIISGATMVITGILAMLFMKETSIAPHIIPVKERFRLFIDTVRKSTSYSMQNKSVRFILTMGVLQSIALQAPNMQWQPLFSSLVDTRASLGLILSGISICFIIGTMLSTRLLGVIRNEMHALTIAQLGMGLGILASALLNWPPLTISLFLFLHIARGIYMPIKDSYFNKHIPSNERATLLSFQSVPNHIGAMAGLLLSGLLAVSMSITTTWILSGSFLILMTLIVTSIAPFGNKRRKIAAVTPTP